MNSRNFITLCVGIVIIVTVVGAIVSGFFIYRDYEATVMESKPLYPQKTMEPVDSFDVVIPFGEITIHNPIYVVHDNDRNVTCYLYDDGISCIPDRFLEEVVV